MRKLTLLASIARLLKMLRDYRRSLNELDALTDHDLRDLRIARDAIPRVAWSEARRVAGLAPDQAQYVEQAKTRSAVPARPARGERGAWASLRSAHTRSDAHAASAPRRAPDRSASHAQRWSI
jgi:uncharacterized protein YjiS (DUF1127 family)